MAAVEHDKLLAWIQRRMKTLDGCDQWDADEFPAGQLAMLREIEDLLEENYFASIGGIV